MSTILLVHCNRLVSGVQYPGISSIAAFVKKSGHGFKFFDVAEYKETLTGKQMDVADSLEPISQYKPVENIEDLPQKKPLENLLSDLEKTIKNLSPDVIGFSCLTDDWPFTLFLIKTIYGRFSDIPIIVGGVHATVAPERILKHREVAAVCIGEGEQPLVEFLDCLDEGMLDTSMRNFYFNNNNQYIKNELRPAFDSSSDSPFLDWEHYSDIHFIYPYEGKLYRRGSISITRGCPYFCTYCVNSFYKDKLYDFGYKVRPKSCDYAIEEITYLKDKFKLEFLRFWDETFLSKPMVYLEKFAKAYATRIKLPFTIETTANSVSQEKVRLLADMGCQSVSIGVETSNENLRKKILKKNISNKCFSKAFKILSHYGIRKVANFMFFLPHQTIKDMYQDIKCCKEWEVDASAPRIFYPYLGTNLRKHCIEQKLIDESVLEKIEEENAITSLDKLNNSWASFTDTVLNFDEDMKRTGKMILKNFILLQKTPEHEREELIGSLI